MKIANKLINILEAEQTYFHNTSIRNGYGILKSDKFIAGIGSGKTISITREKMFPYLDIVSVPLHMTFVLDGKKLNNNYKIKPTAEIGFRRDQGDSEAEELLILKKDGDEANLKNISKYIKEVYFNKDIIDKRKGSIERSAGKLGFEDVSLEGIVNEFKKAFPNVKFSVLSKAELIKKRFK